MENLRAFTRDLMRQMEADLATRLESRVSGELVSSADNACPNYPGIKRADVRSL